MFAGFLNSCLYMCYSLLKYTNTTSLHLFWTYIYFISTKCKMLKKILINEIPRKLLLVSYGFALKKLVYPCYRNSLIRNLENLNYKCILIFQLKFVFWLFSMAKVIETKFESNILQCLNKQNERFLSNSFQPFFVNK